VSQAGFDGDRDLPPKTGVGILESGSLGCVVKILVFGRGEHSERRVAAPGVVEEHRGGELDPGLPAFAV
jgi:hypothetical protein